MKLKLSLFAAVVILSAAMTGCTSVRYGTFRYDNVGFEKQIGKVSFETKPDGSTTATIEGVKNTTPQIVEAAIGAALKAAK